ncbi:DUF1579 domain-containing protein [Methylomonas sp. 11b]|uniref:DUF1579 domain-containing protein n=1 Tax=Methylomonas sp. 11b TaxID=1168169 RepID=UPI00047AD5D5|nr:DUF1579 domain-containing protein [Methylomonas sp. 11b]
MKIELQKEHEWLQQLLGEWTYVSECVTEPGQPPEKFEGTESVRSLGGLWLLCEGCGEMPGGGTATMLMTLGYDARQQRFVGTWIGSMMTHLWIYDGALDANGTVLTLNTEGPCCASEGKLAKQRDVISLQSPQQRLLTSYLLDDEGQWQLFMTAQYRRKT